MAFDVDVGRVAHLPDAAKIRRLAVPQAAWHKRLRAAGLWPPTAAASMARRARRAVDEPHCCPRLLAAVFLRVVLQAALAFETAVFEDLLLGGHAFQREAHLNRLDEHCRVGDGGLVQNRVGIDQREPLDHVFVLVDEVTRHVEPCAAVEVAHVDDERVAFPAAARVAVPRPVVPRMLAVVGRDDANVVHRFVEQRHIPLVLDDLYRIEPAWLVERARNAGQMATRLGILVAAPQRSSRSARPPACIDTPVPPGRGPRPVPPRPPRPPAAKFVPSSEPMNRPWNPPALFIHRPCRSGWPSGSLGNARLCCQRTGIRGSHGQHAERRRQSTPATRSVNWRIMACRTACQTNPRTPCGRPRASLARRSLCSTRPSPDMLRR